MKVFLTGGTGFIGTNVARSFAEAGHELCCLARATSHTDSLRNLNAKLVFGNLADRTPLLDGMKGCDWVINIAAAYSFWMPNRKIFREVNVNGTRNVMECALATGISKFVQISSVVVYGKPAQSPVVEDTPVGPVRFSEYARTKYEGDLIAWNLYETKGLPLVMIYPGCVLGPQDPKASGEYIQNLICRRVPATVLNSVHFPFVHVNDVAEGILRAAEKNNNIGEKYLLVAQNLTFAEINRMISELSGVQLPRLRLPDALTIANAALLTLFSNLIKRPPPWGMSIDQIRTMKNTPLIDASKAQRELGLQYTPIRRAVEDAVASCRG